MNVDRLFETLTEEVKRNMPPDIKIKEIKFEGPLVVVYTDDYEKISANDSVARTLAQTIHRRVDIRPDPANLEDPKTVEAKIRGMIPESANIFDINFIEETGEALIEAVNPNEVVGKEGQLLADLRKESGWNVKVIRAPPIPSKTVSDVRGYLRANHDERQEMLTRVARRLARPKLDGEQWVRVTAMGGFRQVGRSCSLLTTRESKILIDCGLDPSSENTPYFGIPEVQPLDDIDAVVITHAHLDHCGTLPALFKYGYKGPVYCTPPTRDLMALLQLDNIKLGFGENKKTPYEAQHVRQEILHTITLKYNETTDIAPDVRLTFHNAGHILGSAIAHFHIGDGLLDDVYHVVSELCARAVEARGVDEDELRIAAVDDGADAVAGGLGFMGYDGDLLADERVGKRGLADIRPPGDRDHRCFGFHICSPVQNSKYIWSSARFSCPSSISPTTPPIFS